MSRWTPVQRLPRPTRRTGWALTLIGLVVVVGAILGRAGWLPAGTRIYFLLGGVIVFSVGLMITAAEAR